MLIIPVYTRGINDNEIYCCKAYDLICFKCFIVVVNHMLASMFLLLWTQFESWTPRLQQTKLTLRDSWWTLQYILLLKYTISVAAGLLHLLHTCHFHSQVGNGCIGNEVGGCGSGTSLRIHVEFYHNHGLFPDVLYKKMIMTCGSDFKTLRYYVNPVSISHCTVYILSKVHVPY